MHEREIKLSLPGHFDLPPLSLDGEALAVRPLPDLSLRASYHDTDDLRLARHGVTLRHRTGEPDGPRWTLKLPRAATLPGQVERDEIHFAGDRREIPRSARELVTAYTRGEELRPVATLRTRRRRWLLGANGTDLAELADDEVAVVEGRRVVARFRELELEAQTDDAPLSAIAEQLLSAGATPAEPVPKVVRALGSRATAAPDVAVPELAPDASARELVRAAISDALLRIMANDAAARLGFDEGIHQLRVAFRRLRSDLRTFRPLLDPEWVAHIGPMLREHGQRLGSVRDLDVLQARLRADADGLDHALDPLWRDLAERRRESFEALAAALRDPGYVALLYELVAAVGRPPVTPAADGAAAGVGVGLALEAWNRLKRQADALRARDADDAYHAVRIRLKHARYAIEAVARALDPARADDARQLARRLADLQDLLGGLQDAAVAAKALDAAVAERPGDVTLAFAAGRLAERQLVGVRAARAEFGPRWAKARKRRRLRWSAV